MSKINSGAFHELMQLVLSKEGEKKPRTPGATSKFDSVWSAIRRDDLPAKPVSQMTVSEVMSYQKGLLAKGYRSTAVGALQVISGTLKEWYHRAGIGETVLFNGAAQVALFITLLFDKRGGRKFLEGGSVDEFMLELAKEWASFPVPLNMPGHHRQVAAGESYYAGDGMNKAAAIPLDSLRKLALALRVNPDTTVDSLRTKIIREGGQKSTLSEFAQGVQTFVNGKPILKPLGTVVAGVALGVDDSLSSVNRLIEGRAVPVFLLQSKYVSILQEEYNRHGTQLKVDGILGERTIAAARLLRRNVSQDLLTIHQKGGLKVELNPRVMVDILKEMGSRFSANVVAAYQTFLNQYYDAKLAVDGKLGPLTRKAASVARREIGVDLVRIETKKPLSLPPTKRFGIMV